MPQLGELNLRLLCSRKVILICGALSIFGTFHIYTLVLDAPSMDEERMSATCREKYLKMPRKKAPTHILDSDLVESAQDADVDLSNLFSFPLIAPFYGSHC